MHDVKEFGFDGLVSENVFSFWCCLKTPRFYGQLLFSYGHIFTCVHNICTVHILTHTHITHTPLFALLAKWKLLPESDWNLYQFVRRKPKMILLHIILISLVPEIEKKWRKEGGKYPTLHTPDKCRSQDSSCCSISKCSTWPSKKKSFGRDASLHNISPPVKLSKLHALFSGKKKHHSLSEKLWTIQLQWGVLFNTLTAVN